MTLRQLHYFRTLAKVLNYSKAAELLYISQPGLSYAIRSLEKELGIPLFEHNKKKTVLSPYGATLLAYITVGLDSIETGLELVKRQHEEYIRVGNLYSIPVEMTTALIDHFCADTSYSAANFKQYIFESNDSILEALRNNRIDIAFCINANSDCSKVPVFYQHIYFVVSNNNPLANKSVVTFQDIAHMPCAIPDNGVGLRKIIMDLYHAHDLTPEILPTLSITVAISCVMAENCYTIVPTLPAIDFSKLSIINIDNAILKRPIYMAWQKNKMFSALGKEYKNFMLRYADTTGFGMIV